jgi:hypothetical protein
VYIVKLTQSPFALEDTWKERLTPPPLHKLFVEAVW